jgi:hypothetical protein
MANSEFCVTTVTVADETASGGDTTAPDMEGPNTRLTSQLAPEPVSHFRESIVRW